MKFRRWRKREGRCWELSALFLVDNPTAQLVHGRLSRFIDVPESVLDHAWVEYEKVFVDEAGKQSAFRVVYDPVGDAEWEQEIYYGFYGVEVLARYSQSEMCALILERGSYGPWHAEPLAFALERVGDCISSQPMAPATQLVRLLNEPGSCLVRVIHAIGEKTGAGPIKKDLNKPA